MIGKDDAPKSVSSNAGLHSSGFVDPGISPGYSEVIITTQYLAKLFPQGTQQQIRAINHSWGKLPLNANVAPDGNSLVTLGLDWIAQRFDVLNVVAGVQDSTGQRLPSDNFNGVTVARSEQVNGVFLQVESGNDNEGYDDAEGSRVSVDLLAPGVDIAVPSNGATNPNTTRTGTSFAAPHVTGVVALLHEFANFQIDDAPRWDSSNARRHEVIKAVLLNSADKLAGVHGSARTVLDNLGRNWTETDAFSNDQMSLDSQMGAGHLNAARALRQYRSGEWNSLESIPSIGWDFGESGGLSSEYRYPLSVTTSGYIAVTLAWDRPTDKINVAGTPNNYAFTDDFLSSSIAADDLDLFVVLAGEPDPYGFFALRSYSVDDNVEHIFGMLDPGEYEIVVHHKAGGARDYGLAWWVGSNMPGDFDDDGNVDGTDLNSWQGDYGGFDGLSDADFNGATDGSDFLAWQRNFGIAAASATTTAVPEPKPLMLLAVAAVLVAHRSSNGRR